MKRVERSPLQEATGQTFRSNLRRGRVSSASRGRASDLLTLDNKGTNFCVKLLCSGMG